MAAFIKIVAARYGTIPQAFPIDHEWCRFVLDIMIGGFEIRDITGQGPRQLPLEFARVEAIARRVVIYKQPGGPARCSGEVGARCGESVSLRGDRFGRECSGREDRCPFARNRDFGRRGEVYRRRSQGRGAGSSAGNVSVLFDSWRGGR